MPEMPIDILATFVVQDVSDTVYDQYNEICQFSGRAGGELDVESGVLEMTFTPFTVDLGDPQIYEKTTVRFIEVEKLVEVLIRRNLLKNLDPDHPAPEEYVKDLLAEVLDAKGL